MNKLVTGLGVAATVLTIGATTFTMWDDVGWVTPSRHQQDMDDAVTGVKEFRDEWKCDEYEEELIELLKQQEAGDDSVETERAIEKLKDRIKNLRCERFEDT